MPSSAFSSEHRRIRTLLIEARQAAGLTQVQVARRLRRPQSFVSKYETGERRLDVVEFLWVCRAIGVDGPVMLKQVRLGR